MTCRSLPFPYKSAPSTFSPANTQTLIQHVQPPTSRPLLGEGSEPESYSPDENRRPQGDPGRDQMGHAHHPNEGRPPSLARHGTSPTCVTCLRCRTHSPVLTSSMTEFPHMLFLANNASGKIDSIEADEQVNISFYDTASSQWASIAGRAKVNNDRDLIKMHWSTM
jgi:hypothetical protein